MFEREKNVFAFSEKKKFVTFFFFFFFPAPKKNIIFNVHNTMQRKQVIITSVSFYDSQIAEIAKIFVSPSQFITHS